MRSAENYQSIKTPDDEEEDLNIEGIYQELLENATDYDGGKVNFYTRHTLKKRAREIYKKRQFEEESDD